MTAKENILRVYRGEMPEWLPKYGGLGGVSKGAASQVFPVGMPKMVKGEDGMLYDAYGVPHEISQEAGGAAMPSAKWHILEDITKWRDVIKNPDINQFDFERLAKEATANWDRENIAYGFSTLSNWVQGLISFMGFEEALIAFYEEPEEVHAMFDYLGSFHEEIFKRAIPYFKPDYFMHVEDTASAQNPFISPEMYKEFLFPYYKRFNDIGLNAGLPCVHHNCGRCEDYIPMWMELGIGAWEPAEVKNDLVGIKAKYGRKLAIAGGWDPNAPCMLPGASEELVRESVRKYIDTFAPEGGFVFAATGRTLNHWEGEDERDAWILDEYENYGKNYYNK